MADNTIDAPSITKRAVHGSAAIAALLFEKGNKEASSQAEQICDDNIVCSQLELRAILEEAYDRGYRRGYGVGRQEK